MALCSNKHKRSVKQLCDLLKRFQFDNTALAAIRVQGREGVGASGGDVYSSIFRELIAAERLNLCTGKKAGKYEGGNGRSTRDITNLLEQCKVVTFQGGPVHRSGY